MKTALQSFVAASLSLSALVVVGAADAAPAKPIKATYQCDKGQSLRVVFQGGKAVVTAKGGKPLLLRQAITADGFLYTNGKVSLRGRGDDAMWTVGKRAPLTCHAQD